MLGLVTVLYGCSFFRAQSFLHLGFAWLSYGWVDFSVFQRLEVFSGQGISQGQLRLCRVEVWRLEFFCAQGWLGLLAVGQSLGFFSLQRSFPVRVYVRVSYGFLGLRFFLVFRVVFRLGLARFSYFFVGLMVFQCLEVFSGQGICQGQLQLCSVQVFQGLEWFRAQGWLRFLIVGQGLGFFSCQRYFAVRVYLRVGYDFVGFRFLRVQSCFALRAFSVFYSFLGFRVQSFLRLGYCFGLVTVVQGLGFFRAQSGFALTVGLGFLRLGKVQGFLGFRGFLRLWYFLGFVTVVQGLDFLRVQTEFAPRVVYGCLGFRVFEGLEFLRLGYCLGLVTVVQGIGFFRVQSGFALTVVQGRLRLGRVQGFSGFRGFLRFEYCLGLVMVV